MKKNKSEQPIFLCGMMGSGKSTIGKLLARELRVPFNDLDTLIERKLKMNIPEIFDRLGQEKFRRVERDLLLETSRSVKGVMALGGGALQNQRLVDHVKQQGRLVFLDCPRSVLSGRLRNKTNRPMLKPSFSDNPDERIDSLINERLPFYTQAHITVDTGEQSKKQVVNSIIHKLNSYE